MTKSPQVLRWGNFPARASGPLSSVPPKVFLKQNFHVMQSFPQTKFHCHAKCSSNANHVTQIIPQTKFPCHANYVVPCHAKSSSNEIFMPNKVFGTKFPCPAKYS